MPNYTSLDPEPGGDAKTLFLAIKKFRYRLELAYGNAFYSETDSGTYTKLHTPGAGAGQRRRKT
jgi:hypothetical protein